VSDDHDFLKRHVNSFQWIILALEHYWAAQGCVILQSYDMEVVAGIFHPAILRMLGPKPWNAAFVQRTRGPNGHRHEFIVMLKPAPFDLEFYLESLEAAGVEDTERSRFDLERDWAVQCLGASGHGWKSFCENVQVASYACVQRLAGHACDPVSGVLSYDLERLAMYVQGVEEMFTLGFSENVSYGDVFTQAALEYSHNNLVRFDEVELVEQFEAAETACQEYIDYGKMALPAYDQFLKARYALSQLDARKAILEHARPQYFARMRTMAEACGRAWLAGDSVSNGNTMS
jgi:glycyl-tRNA synthetase alpha chain